MTANDWTRIQRLFYAAVELPSDQQAEYLQQECGEDTRLLRQVRSLLLEVTDDSLEQAVADVTSRLQVDAEPEPGDRIGSWVITRLLGEGGMGRVYLAERADEEYRKKVAIKLVHGELLGSVMIARFRAERQILATLEHPNIARMLEGGTTSGRPYVVMEYIDGVPVDAYCRRQASSVRETLELFCQVCDAVQYAHQNLIIHRDIKPGNILVDSSGAARLLDFGIAKLLTPDPSAGAPALTRAAERILTPEYASPEQILGTPVTTASDVYSLGVLLFELLTGKPLHARDRPLSHVAEENVRKASTVAPKERRRELAGDLDNIIRKATAADPAERYPTAGQLGDDVRRYLEGFPVVAQAASWRYRTRKFIWRHKAGVTGAALFVVSLICFAVGMGVLAKQANAEAENARAVSSFLVDIFRVANPAESRGRTITAQEILDRGAVRVRTELHSRPEVQATLMQAMGQVYIDLGLLDKAGPLLSEALDIREKTSGSDTLETASMLASLAEYYDTRSDFVASERCLTRMLAIRQKLFPASDHRMGDAWSDIGLNLYYQARYREAAEAQRRALAIFRSAGKEESIESALNNLAIADLELGEYRAAEETHRENIARRTKRLGETHPLTVISMNNLTFVLEMLGEYQERDEIARKVLTIRRKVLGETHHETAKAWTNAGFCRRSLGDKAGFIHALERALAIREGRSDEDDVELAMNRFSLADALAEQGEIHRAQELADRARASLERRPMPTRKAQCLRVLGKVAWAAGRRREAEVRFEQALAQWRRLPGRARLGEADTLVDRGELHLAAGSAGEAARDFREALDRRSAILPPDHVQVANAQAALGQALCRLGRAYEGAPLLRASIEILARRLPQDHVDTAIARWWLAQQKGPESDLLRASAAGVLRKYRSDRRLQVLAGTAGRVAAESVIGPAVGLSQ